MKLSRARFSSRKGGNKVIKKRSQDISHNEKYPGVWQRITIALGTTRPGKVANAVGISASAVSEWRKGTRPPSLDFFLKIANLGGVTLDWLITGEDRPSHRKDGGEGEGTLVGSFLHTCVPDKVTEKIKSQAAASGKSVKQELIEVIEVGLATKPITQPLQEFSEFYRSKINPPKEKPTKPRRKRKASKPRPPQ